MDQVVEFVKAQLNGNKADLLVNVTILEAVVTFAFVICSFVVSGTANAGFNVVLTGFLNIGFVVGSYYVLKHSKAPIAIGFLIGSAAIMTLLNFMTAIYWGQLSHCKVVSENLSQYSCYNKTAYGAVCFFSVVLFLLQLAFTSGTISWRGELINEQPADYQNVNRARPSNPYESASSHYTPPSADL